MPSVAADATSPAAILSRENLCRYTQQKLGDVPPTKLTTIMHPMATAFLRILSITYIPNPSSNLSKLVVEVSKDAVAGNYKRMLRHREEGARIYSILGAHPYPQTAPAPAAAYAIYLLAEIYHDENSRLSIYSMVEAMRYLNYAGVSTESMSGIINLLLT